MLSADGRWRLDDQRLYDLKNDPFAKNNVAIKERSKVKELKQLFLDWRKEVHRLKLDTQVLRQPSLPNTYKITGDSFRRTPGYGGFTLVTSLTPVGEQKPVGMMAQQKGMWEMELTADSRIRLRMHDHEVVSKPLTIRPGCSALVLSTYYYRSRLQPKFDHGAWLLMLDGKIVLEEKWPHPAVFPEAFFEATYVGQDHSGKRFTGQLENPSLYNEFFYPKDPWKVERDPRWLSGTVCQKPAG